MRLLIFAEGAALRDFCAELPAFLAFRFETESERFLDVEVERLVGLDFNDDA